MSAPWFLLFGGSSADGLGPGVFVGRTTVPAEAERHYRMVRRDPYSTGYVVIVSDDSYVRADPCTDWAAFPEFQFAGRRSSRGAAR